jgi:hypothetical protein
LVVLQYLPEGRLRCDVWPASYSGANVDVNVRAEECLDIEEEVSPMSATSSGIKSVADVIGYLLVGFRQYKYPLFYAIRYSEQRTFVRVLFPGKGDYADYV